MAYDSNLAEALTELHDSRQRRNELETQLSLATAEIAALKLVAEAADRLRKGLAIHGLMLAAIPDFDSARSAYDKLKETER